MVKRKKGDTLVEVMLAVGIFSLVAIVVTSVVSGSTSSAQTALEATLAREEVDAQAEALRFIHAAYISNPEGDFKYLWEELITENAVTIPAGTTDISSILGVYPPTTCDAIYSVIGEDGEKHLSIGNAFIINPRNLDLLTNGTLDPEYIGLRIYHANNTSSSKLFTPASTYPHIVYGTVGNDTDTVSLINDKFRGARKAEGIYDIAVAGPDYGDTGVPQYYDFYIRTCWYGTGDRNASTISTVIRLYNPAVMLSTGS